MQRRWKWAIWSGSSVVGLLLVAILVISWISGQGLLHPDREIVATTPDDVGLEWSWSNFTSADGPALVGWWMPADASPADNASVIFLHGYGDSKNQSLEIAPFLHAAGYNVLAFDFRAHGASGGAFTTAGLLEPRDAAAAVAWLKAQPDMPSDPKIALIGWSMGGATALRAAPDLPEVDAVVSDASFSKLRNIVDTSIVSFIKDAIGFTVPRWPIGPLSVQFAAWSIGEDLSKDAPVRDIGRIHRPILLIQGTADPTVLPSNVDELAAAGGSDVEVLRIEGAKHVKCYRTAPAQYEAAVLAFLASAFAGA